MKHHDAGYTLLEVIIAAALLMMAVAAAAALSLATSTQEEANAHIARCLNLQEQAVRLYQLGLSTNTIADILPADPAVASLTFTTNSLVITNLGTVEQASVKLVFSTAPLTTAWTAGTWSSGESSTTARRTNTMTAIRRSIR